MHIIWYDMYFSWRMERTASRRTLPFEDNCYENRMEQMASKAMTSTTNLVKKINFEHQKMNVCAFDHAKCTSIYIYIYTYFTNLSKCQIILGIGFPQVLLRLELVPPPIRNCSKMPSASDHLRWGFGFTRSGAERFGTIFGCFQK